MSYNKQFGFESILNKGFFCKQNMKLIKQNLSLKPKTQLYRWNLRLPGQAIKQTKDDPVQKVIGRW